MSAKVKATRVAEYKAKKQGKSVSAPTDTPSADTFKPRPIMDMPPKKMFVHVKDPDDHDTLLHLKQTCGHYAGTTDIVLVLGEEKKSAIRLPFRVDGSDELMGALVKQLGEDAVVLK